MMERMLVRLPSGLQEARRDEQRGDYPEARVFVGVVSVPFEFGVVGNKGVDTKGRADIEEQLRGFKEAAGSGRCWCVAGLGSSACSGAGPWAWGA